jgi:hypothetical protein
MKFLKGILKVLGVFLLIYLVSAFFAKSTYRVERMAIIHAPMQIVYSQVGILTNWERWSPWNEKDPTAKNTYEGANGQPGSIMKWNGDKKIVGSGQIKIISADVPVLMKYELTFDGPPEMHSIGGFQLMEESTNETKLIWNDLGQIPFLMRPMMMFQSMDKWMGPDFERGLVKLDSLCRTMLN